MADPHTSSPISPEIGERDVLVRRKRRFWLWTICLSGAGMVISPFAGLIGVVVGMKRGFNALAETGEKGHVALGNGISTTLMASALGLAVFFIAFAVFVAALTRFVMLPKIAGSDHGQ